MNAGAKLARGHYLWFLHVDSGFGPELVTALQQALRLHSRALLFCRLRFMNDGPGAMRFNEWGVALRANLLGIPFGDQGFCLERQRFWELGGYCEQALYGEDHLLLWRARRSGLSPRLCPAPLLTSARKYRQVGWGRLTWRYQWLWLRQALPQLWLLLLGR